MKQIINVISPAFAVSHRPNSESSYRLTTALSLKALGRRTFATAVPHSLNNLQQQQPQEPSHAPSTVTAQPEANIGIEEEDMPTNLVYEDAGEGAVDVTDAVLEMLNRDNGTLLARPFRVKECARLI